MHYGGVSAGEVSRAAKAWRLPGILRRIRIIHVISLLKSRGVSSGSEV